MEDRRASECGGRVMRLTGRGGGCERESGDLDIHGERLAPLERL